MNPTNFAKFDPTFARHWFINEVLKGLVLLFSGTGKIEYSLRSVNELLAYY